VKFLADMGISPGCIVWLREQGYDAIHLFEHGLHRSSDSEVLRKAKNENRILLTMDLDFARLVSMVKEDDLPTVIIFRLSDQRPHNVQARIVDILPVLKKIILQGSFILSVKDNKVRIRHLPIT